MPVWFGNGSQSNTYGVCETTHSNVGGVLELDFGGLAEDLKFIN